MTDEPANPASSDLSYFGIQAEWGVTKHFGGLRATERMAALAGIGRGQTVLEIGCGVGVTGRHLVRTYGCRLVGIDLNPKMPAWARRRALRSGTASQSGFLQANALHLPFPDGSFHVALCESVTAFVGDKPRALAEYRRVVRPGGFVALNEGTWLAAPPASLLDFVQRTMDNVRFQSAGEWQALLAGAGLEPVAAEVTGIDVLRQRLDENAGLDGRDWLDRLRAVGMLMRRMLTDPAFRRYARTLTPSRQVLREMFKYLAYGIYVGRVPG